jgi:integrase
MSIRRIRNSWWVDFRVNLTRYRVRSPENTQAGAKAYEAVLRHKLTIGEQLKPAPAPPPAPTFAAFSAEWFETYVRANCKPSTQVSRWSVLERHLLPSFGDLALSAVDVARIERYKMTKLGEGLSARSINLHLSTLSKCLHDAIAWGVLVAAPGIKRLRQSRFQFDFLSHDEADVLVAAMAEGHWQRMITLALNTGLRIGELLGLQWNDVDTDARQMVVRRSIVNGIIGTTKTNRERQLPLSTAAIAALAASPRDHLLVFHRGDGAPLTYGMAQYMIERAWMRAGLRPVTWHVMRHTFASWLVADGVPLPVVQGLLGHTSIEMTMRYSHLAPSTFRSAIDVLERRCHPTPVEYSWATGGQRSPIPVLPIDKSRPSAASNYSLN